MTSSNATPGEAQRAIDETMQTYWGPVSGPGRDHDDPRRARRHMASDLDTSPSISTSAGCSCSAESWGLPPCSSAPSVLRVSMVAAHGGALVGRRGAASVAPGRGRSLAYAGAYRLLHRRRNLSDRGCDEVSRHVPRFMGVDGDERDRRPDPGRADDQRVAGHRDLGARIDRRVSTSSARVWRSRWRHSPDAASSKRWARRADEIPRAQRSGTMSSVHHRCELGEKRHTNAAIFGVWKIQPRDGELKCQILSSSGSKTTRFAPRMFSTSLSRWTTAGSLISRTRWQFIGIIAAN